MHILRNGLIIGCVSLVSACGGGSGGSSTDSRSLNLEQASLEGAWQRCEYEDVGIVIEGQNSELFRTTMANGGWNDVFIGYASSDCTGPELYVEEYTGSYNIAGTVTTDSGVSAIQVDWVNEEGEVYCYDLVHVDGNLLYWGDLDLETDCESPETRPTDIYFEYPLERVSN